MFLHVCGQADGGPHSDAGDRTGEPGFKDKEGGQVVDYIGIAADLSRRSPDHALKLSAGCYHGSQSVADYDCYERRLSGPRFAAIECVAYQIPAGWLLKRRTTAIRLFFRLHTAPLVPACDGSFRLQSLPTL